MITTHQYLHRKYIDIDKWDNLVKQHHDGYPYQYSWYLDALTDSNWYAVVFGDYRAIFPLAVNRKWFGLRQAYQPFLSQRFDLIGKVRDEDYSSLAQLIASKFSRVNIHTSIPLGHQKLAMMDRINQVIDLNHSIDQLRGRYTKTARRLLRKHEGRLEVSMTNTIYDYLAYYRQAEFPKSKPILKQWPMFERLLHAIDQQGQLEIVRTSYQGKTINMSAFIVTDRRVINLIGASDALSREHYGNYAKVDAMIAKYANRPLLFDCFGSNMKGVQTFNKHFGTSQEVYHGIKKA